MQSVYDPRSFHRDGTPKRKYEIDETDQKRLALRVVIGLVVFNVVVLIKNILFGSEDQRSWGDDRRAEDESRSASNLGDVQGEDASDRRSISPDPSDEDEAALGDSQLDKLHSASHLSRAPSDDGSGGGGTVPLQLPSSANDNETLYGARPGTVVTAFNRDDGDTIGGGGGGGGSSGGGGAPDDDDDSDDDIDPIDDEDEDEDEDEDDQDDDDDDDDSNTPRLNRLPVLAGPVLLTGLLANSSIVIAFSDLLRNASDADGDALRVVQLTASSGTLQVLQGNAGWVYRPDANDTSSVTFTYGVSDGIGATPQTALMDLLEPDDTVIRGTEGDDRIIGTPQDDVIDALAGNDVVVGLSGDDVIYGGAGDDRLLGEAGNDLIYGGDGHDVVFGGDGFDFIFGGFGEDVLFGGLGSDTLYGEEGDDIISGGADADLVVGGDGDDDLMGDEGADLLEGGDGDDRLDGGAESDVLIGGAGEDDVLGGAGADVARATSYDNNDRYDGGTGIDTYDSSSTSADIVVNLQTGKALSAETGIDSVSNIENITTGQGDDAITGDAEANVIVAGAGADVVAGLAADDTIVATQDDGDDHYDGGTGIDTYDSSSTHADIVVDLEQGVARSADTGDDSVSNVENVKTGDGDDAITGDEEENIIVAGGGHDVVASLAANDVIHATLEDGNDVYDGGEGVDTYDASATSADIVINLAAQTSQSTETGSDELLNIENVTTGAGDDVVCGDDANNIISVGAGDDRVVASVMDGDDRYDGGSGTDVYDLSETSADATIDLAAGTSESDDTGHDTITGFENVIGSSGDDRIIANSDVNVLFGGDGEDIFVFQTAASIGSGHGSRDRILDFSVGDRIDLRDISDDLHSAMQGILDDPVMRRFVLISQGDVFDKPGQMRLKYDLFDDAQVTVLEGNLDTDDEAEFELELVGHHELQYESFR